MDALRPMLLRDLEAVGEVEARAYAFPWSRGNFIDSLAAGYLAEVLEDGSGRLLGYFVAMPGVDEMHLLNLTVAPEWQGRGHARTMLQALVEHSRQRRAQQLWLEVRQSNDRARRLYREFGFVAIGLRRDYYPAPDRRREDATVMCLDLRCRSDDEL